METLDDLTVILVCEGAEEATYEFYLQCWQHLVDTGLAWQLQGWFGRMAEALIDAGHIQPQTTILRWYNEES